VAIGNDTLDGGDGDDSLYGDTFRRNRRRATMFCTAARAMTRSTAGALATICWTAVRATINIDGARR
jgi:Ca2+-binding RTX toxin-like protein